MTLDDHEELEGLRHHAIPRLDAFICKARSCNVSQFRHLLQTRDALVSLMVQAERECLEAVPPPGAVQPRERVISVPYLTVVDG